MKKRIMTAEQLSDFERLLAMEEKSALTISKYRHDVGSFLDYCSGRAVTKELVIDYKTRLCGEYAVSSVNSMIAALNSFFRFMEWDDVCVKACKVQRKIFCDDNKELSREEYMKLVKTAEKKNKYRLCLVLQTLCGTGIRISELEYITVEAVKRGKAEVFCKNKIRTVFIVEKLREKLLKYCREKGIRKGRIFLSRNGRPLCRNNVWLEMKKLCKEAGVDDQKVFPHNLRHLFARMFYRMENDLAKLADILGHTCLETTRLYVITTGFEHGQRMERMKLIL